MRLVFEKSDTDGSIKEIFDHTIDAFSDSPDFKWSIAEIKREIKAGWELYAVKLPDQIIAAAFVRNEEGKILHTKNTAVKMSSQGSGVSHQIKEFFEEKARELKVKKIVHYCRIDNFRMYALNESHDYQKTDKKNDEDGLIVVWEKELK